MKRKHSRLLLALYLAFTLAPIYWMVHMSLRSNLAITSTFAWLPESLSFANYATIFTDPAWYGGYVNSIIYVVLNTILTELGHRVDFAGTGEATVAAVNRGGYDLVLMDVTLPGMDGLAATRAIRALTGEAARIPVIGISGHTDARDEDAAISAGMNAFLAKPVSPAALAQLVAKFVG